MIYVKHHESKQVYRFTAAGNEYYSTLHEAWQKGSFGIEKCLDFLAKGTWLMITEAQAETMIAEAKERSEWPKWTCEKNNIQSQLRRHDSPTQGVVCEPDGTLKPTVHNYEICIRDGDQIIPAHVALAEIARRVEAAEGKAIETVASKDRSAICEIGNLLLAKHDCYSADAVLRAVKVLQEEQQNKDAEIARLKAELQAMTIDRDQEHAGVMDLGPQVAMLTNENNKLTADLAEARKGGVRWFVRERGNGSHVAGLYIVRANGSYIFTSFDRGDIHDWRYTGGGSAHIDTREVSPEEAIRHMLDAAVKRGELKIKAHVRASLGGC